MRLVACALALPMIVGSSVGCGAAPRRIAQTRDDVEVALRVGQTELEGEPARRAREALNEAEASERRGQQREADEHASRARAWASVAADEASVAALEEELGRMEAETLEVAAQSAALEHETEARRAANQALADANAAREELVRALHRAEADEAVPRRARRVGLAEPGELRRMADVLEQRARLLLAAAIAMGAHEEVVGPARESVAAIDGLADPLPRLEAADRAHAQARLALADARARGPSEPGPEAIAALAEALSTEGFALQREEQGLGARLADAFDGPAIAAASRGRIRRLAELLASFPRGPLVLLVEADGDRAAQALAARRLEALRRAVLGSTEREVVVAILTEVRMPGGEPAAAANAARVLLSAYVPRGPVPLAPAEPRSTAPASTVPQSAAPSPRDEALAGE